MPPLPNGWKFLENDPYTLQREDKSFTHVGLDNDTRLNYLKVSIQLRNYCHEDYATAWDDLYHSDTTDKIIHN